jgi:hypothetical protein
MKTDKTGPIRVGWFTENHRLNLIFLKNIRNIEIKNPKKLAFILRILIKIELKNLLSFILEKSSKFAQLLKSKKRNERFLLTHDHRCLILFLPYLSCTLAITSHHRRQSNHRSMESVPSVGFTVTNFGKPAIPADFWCKNINF